MPCTQHTRQPASASTVLPRCLAQVLGCLALGDTCQVAPTPNLESLARCCSLKLPAGAPTFVIDCTRLDLTSSSTMSGQLVWTCAYRPPAPSSERCAQVWCSSAHPLLALVTPNNVPISSPASGPGPLHLHGPFKRRSSLVHFSQSCFLFLLIASPGNRRKFYKRRSSLFIECRLSFCVRKRARTCGGFGCPANIWNSTPTFSTLFPAPSPPIFRGSLRCLLVQSILSLACGSFLLLASGIWHLASGILRLASCVLHFPWLASLYTLHPCSSAIKT